MRSALVVVLICLPISVLSNACSYKNPYTEEQINEALSVLSKEDQPEAVRRNALKVRIELKKNALSKQEILYEKTQKELDLITKDDDNTGARTGEKVGSTLGVITATGAIYQESQTEDIRFEICMEEKGYRVNGDSGDGGKPLAEVPAEPMEEAVAYCEAKTSLSLKEMLEVINQSRETFGGVGRAVGSVSDSVRKGDGNREAKTGESVEKTIVIKEITQLKLGLKEQQEEINRLEKKLQNIPSRTDVGKNQLVPEPKASIFTQISQQQNPSNNPGEQLASEFDRLPKDTQFEQPRFQCLNDRARCLRSGEGWGICAGVFAACLVFGE
jgi:hypothetical protein